MSFYIILLSWIQWKEFWLDSEKNYELMQIYSGSYLTYFSLYQISWYTSTKSYAITSW